VHLGILAICHQSRLDRLHTADLAIQFGNKICLGDIELLVRIRETGWLILGKTPAVAAI